MPAKRVKLLPDWQTSSVLERFPFLIKSSEDGIFEKQPTENCEANQYYS